MSTQDRRDLVLSRRTQIEQEAKDWRNQLRGENLVWNILRAGLLLLVLLVVGGVWTVVNAHLGEQLLAAPKQTAGLIDPNANQFTLSPGHH